MLGIMRAYLALLHTAPRTCAAILMLAAMTVMAAQPAPPPGVLKLAPQPPVGPQPDAGMAARGALIFQQLCAACHGARGRGGPGGSPDITQSAVAMAADGGSELRQFLLAGRPEKGMPPFPLGEAEALDLSAAIRSLGFAAASAQPAMATGTATRANAGEDVLVGDAMAGKAYFFGPVGRCNSCHAVEVGGASTASNLWNISTKYPDARVLQNNMVLNRSFFWTPAYSNDITATVSWRDGRKASGYLSSVSDFKVIVRDDAGMETSWPRKDGEPRVVLTDRMQHHLDLLPKYRDSDIHDLTAYLVTLR
jgi:cytochrome c oxidase cbb3-type subunit III